MIFCSDCLCWLLGAIGHESDSQANSIVNQYFTFMLMNNSIFVFLLGVSHQDTSGD